MRLALPIDSMFKSSLEKLYKKIRVKYRWQAIDQQNEAIEKAKKNNKRFESEVLTNGDTLKQLLARSRYLLYKNKSKWSQNQIQRANLLFELYPDIKKNIQSNARTKKYL